MPNRIRKQPQIRLEIDATGDKLIMIDESCRMRNVCTATGVNRHAVYRRGDAIDELIVIDTEALTASIDDVISSDQPPLDSRDATCRCAQAEIVV
jgi:hypothetical protein